MGYACWSDRDLSLGEKLAMLGLWITLGGLPLFFVGVALLGAIWFVGVIQVSEAIASLATAVGVIFVVPSIVGALGYAVGILMDVVSRRMWEKEGKGKGKG